MNQHEKKGWRPGVLGRSVATGRSGDFHSFWHRNHKGRLRPKTKAFVFIWLRHGVLGSSWSLAKRHGAPSKRSLLHGWEAPTSPELEALTLSELLVLNSNNSKGVKSIEPCQLSANPN